MNRKDMALIKQALAISARKETEAFESLPEVEFTPSESYKSKMEEILHGKAKPSTYEDIKRKRLAVATIAVAIIVSLLTACTAIKPIRNFFVEIFEEYVNLKFKADPENNKIQSYYKLEYVPNGYLKVFDNKALLNKIEQYEKDCMQLHFEQSLLVNGNFKIDYKDAQIENIVINEIEITGFTKNGQRSLYWEDGTYFFTLTFPQSLPDEEIEKIIAGITAEG